MLRTLHPKPDMKTEVLQAGVVISEPVETTQFWSYGNFGVVLVWGVGI